jgi:hypothetical protein
MHSKFRSHAGWRAASALVSSLMILLQGVLPTVHLAGIDSSCVAGLPPTDGRSGSAYAAGLQTDTDAAGHPTAHDSRNCLFCRSATRADGQASVGGVIGSVSVACASRLVRQHDITAPALVPQTAVSLRAPPALVA